MSFLNFRHTFFFVIAGILLISINTYANAYQTKYIEHQSERSRIDVPTYGGEGHTDNPDDFDQIQLAAEIIPGSKIVFQSFRSNQWQLFSTNSNGTQLTRLTTTHYFTVLPHGNKGLGELAYIQESSTSNITDTELWVRNLDGTNKVKVASGVQIGYFSWAPNNEDIVLSSTNDPEDDEHEISILGEARLTYNDYYDGMPSWSPDGSKIAWVSYESNGYRIWVMDRDGTNKRMLSRQPFSFRPVWSPDGSQIAFDADSDLDGWQEVWVMDADGANQYKVHQLGDNKDAWVSGWSPDGRFITYTNISFIQFQQNWYWTEAYLEAVNPTQKSLIRLSTSGLDWHSDWQMVDTQHPDTILQLNQLSPSGEISIQWEVKNDYSPTDYTDVQYKIVGEGGWKTLGQSREPYLRFSGIPGKTYLFRARSVDKAGNVEPWGNTATMSTTIFSQQVKGVVVDNRGALVDYHEASFLNTPIANDPTPSGFIARFDSQDVETSLFTPSYGSIPDTHSHFSQNRTQTFIAPPKDNLILNGNFEATELTEWLSTGLISPTLSTFYEHTGVKGVTLGGANQLGEICVLPEGSTAQTHCSITKFTIQSAIDAANDFDTIWVYPGTYKENLLIFDKQSLTLRSVGGYENTLIDGNFSGVVMFIEQSPNTQINGFTIKNGSEGIHTHGTDVGAIEVYDSPSISIVNNYIINNYGSSTGGINLSYADNASIINNWFLHNRTSPVSGGSSSCISRRRSFNVVIHNNIFWNNNDSRDDICIGVLAFGDESIINNVFINNSENIDSFSHADIQNNIILNSPNFGIGNKTSTQSAKCSNGVISYNNVADNWRDYPDNCDSLTGINGNISDNPHFRDLYGGDFRLIPDSPSKDSGNPDAAFLDTDGSRNDMGVFGGPTPFPQPIMEQTPISSWNHHWIDMEDWIGEEISITFGIKNSEGTLSSAISQNVNMPLSLHNPTLSFMYQSKETAIGGNEQFIVKIESNDSIQEYIIADSIETQLLIALDDVSLGSTYTDVWVKMADSLAAPGTTIEKIIQFGNQGSIDASEGLLTVDLPDDISFISSSIPPTSTSSQLVWNLSALASLESSEISLFLVVSETAVVDSAVSIDLEISTNSLETAILNNNQTVDIQISYQSYLPIIFE